VWEIMGGVLHFRIFYILGAMLSKAQIVLFADKNYHFIN
jgi:hypothetical protein